MRRFRRFTSDRTMSEQRKFVFKGLHVRVIFGRGELARVSEEAQRMGLRRVAVLTTPHQEQTGAEVVDLLGSMGVGNLATAAMHTPVEVTETALAWCKDRQVDGVVSVGGGSAIGLGKAIALRTDLPQLCIPTTYAGSEMTDILGQTVKGEKTTQRGPQIQPEVVIYDPSLTDTLPPALAISSGFNAMAHAVEALYATDCNPIIAQLATDGLCLLVRSLPNLATEEARDEALKGAWFCGVALGSCTMALHHKLAHVLGGAFGLPHAQSHTALLPFSLAYNEPALNGELKPIKAALKTDNLAQALFDLAKSLGAPTSLAEVGMPASGIETATEIAMAAPYPNPRALTKDGIRALLDDAYHGRRPA